VGGLLVVAVGIVAVEVGVSDQNLAAAAGCSSGLAMLGSFAVAAVTVVAWEPHRHFGSAEPE
jgi:hypothetical protein